MENNDQRSSRRKNDDKTYFQTRSSGLSWMDEIIQDRLKQRIQRGTARRLLYTDTTTTCVARTNENHHIQQPTSNTTNVKPAEIDDGNASTGSTTTTAKSIDFSSNDYLGLARDMEQYRMVEEEMEHYILSVQPPPRNHESQHDKQQLNYSTVPLLGSTGSRLLSGDTKLLHELEAYLCHIHHAQSALLCNSGYDANLSVVSTLPCTCILYDSYIHNSLHMGIRLWQSQSITTATATEIPTMYEREANTETRKAVASFQHNNVQDLRQKLQYFKNQGHTIVILIESVYSMDGDMAPVREILDLAESYQSLVVVDEAHGFGVFGKTEFDNDTDGSNRSSTISRGGTGVLAMTQCEHHPALLAAIYTYGKAAGCHGAVICSPHTKYMKEYWINYAYPIIYSTALPLHSILTIRCSYQTITGTKGRRLRRHLSQLIQYFQGQLIQMLDTLRITWRNHPYRILQSSSPIQALIVPGNVECTTFCQLLFRISDGTIRLFPIKTPTVPVGQERIRIVLHAHNTMQEIDRLLRYIEKALQGLQNTAIGTLYHPPQFSKL
jgi:8-amino-7-oxononanoate synthase